MVLVAIVIRVLLTKLRDDHHLTTEQSRKSAKELILLFPLLDIAYILFIKIPSEPEILYWFFKYLDSLLQATQVQAAIRRRPRSLEERKSTKSTAESVSTGAPVSVSTVAPESVPTAAPESVSTEQDQNLFEPFVQSKSFSMSASAEDVNE
ncbi:corticotropin-releasing factor receptor 1 [Plakobranchus ocellatus]|uniref:Corticotropin-releasing factor receptor 1 n=1 Tax=Plakobranchus ocellatus TaxID=259542 RepID=A0AAV4AE12_9GAST|nr:corticotropin-releasing factor receptor 1 [Plakobranchus ocellatus]